MPRHPQRLKEQDKQKIAEFRHREHQELMNRILQEQQERSKRKEKEEHCFDTNLEILKNIIAQCPEKHLIVIERTCCSSTITFEESIEVLLEEFSPNDTYSKEDYSFRSIINPANLDDYHFDAFWVACELSVWPNEDKFYGGYGLINLWKFIPYPENW